MRDNFGACLAEVLKHEGGWSQHPRDPGGATMQGITLATYSKYLGRQATPDELRRMPQQHRDTIYRQFYWDKVRGDDLPRGVDLCLFDYAVNSGPGRAIRDAQKVVGAEIDGILGPKTLWAVQKADAATLVTEVCKSRLSFLHTLPTWDVFGGGWQRRVKEVEEKGRAMCATS